MCAGGGVNLGVGCGSWGVSGGANGKCDPKMADNKKGWRKNINTSRKFMVQLFAFRENCVCPKFS